MAVGFDDILTLNDVAEYVRIRSCSLHKHPIDERLRQHVEKGARW